VQNRNSIVDNYRGLLRKIHYGRGRSSYPYISGDTYAALCGATYSENSDLDFLLENTAIRRLFLPAYLKDSFLNAVAQSESTKAEWSVFIHNYDNIPSDSELLFLSEQFKNVYCVNWLGDEKIATPIPIGLENWSHLRNGVPRDFHRNLKNEDLNFQDRPIHLLSSFSTSTNLIERSKAVEFVRNYDKTFLMPDFSAPANYRKIVRSSKFVISPPGNGPDCHRTWEALYLGAVPIVLRESWPFSHVELPVIIVDDWEEIPEKTENYVHTGDITVDELCKLFLEF
jgi:hypothetical protein